ncbi:MAG: M1 family metallopeptidase [Algibacter sp.]
MKNVFLFLFLFSISIGVSQQVEFVDFKSGKADLSFKPNGKEVGGHITYTFDILKDIDSVYIDAKNFIHIEYLFNENIYHEYDNKHIIIRSDFKKGENHQVDIGFVTSPKKAMYFIDWEHEKGNNQIWTQGQGKYTSNWLPSIDDMNEKIEFDLNITFDNGYEVISNGKLINKQINESITTWHYDMQKPMSSYLVALAIGKYCKKVEYSKSGIPLEMYYYPEDSLKVEPTYRYTKQMFDFLEDEIGVPYPWQNYKQVPVKDFLYAGMENTSTTIFSDAFVIDSIAFVDKNYINVNAHELAHQWFGDLVTETSGTHHWLQEGFATYYALLAEREVFGDDYYYWQLYEYAQELLEQRKVGGSTSLLDPKSSSTTFYKKGAWTLHMLRGQVGDDAFRKGVRNYLLKYQFKNVETDDFIREVEKASGEDLNEFVETWLESDELNYHEMEDYFYLTSIEYKGFINSKHENFKNDSLGFFDSDKNSNMFSEKVKSLKDKISKDLFETKDIKVRQAIAQSLSKIPPELKTEYESLLDDESYTTIEAALFGLWNSFPEEQNKYLNKTKGIIGFNNKNIRILWLTLAIISDDFEPENSEIYFKELEGYTSPKFDFEIRQNAFSYLVWISSCADQCEENLKQAAKHHNWRFSKFAKNLLENM